MIERIYCRNFRRIEEANIPVRDGITMIVGSNGSGKSTIMEAILFNLFGKSKAGTKKDSVRRKGAAETDITVTIVDFKVGDSYYRCHRWYTAKGSPMAELRQYSAADYERLCEKDPDLPADKTLGEEVASSTNGVTAYIESLLGISYEGFKASFMAQQKELNSMTSLTPEKRKEFFLDILGYSRLDKIKPKITQDLRAAQTSRDVISKQNLSVPQLERDIKKLEDDIADKTKRIEAGTAKTDAKKAELKTAAAAYEESNLAAVKATEFKRDVEVLDTEKSRLLASNKQLEETLAANRIKAKGYDENSPLSKRIADARDKASKARAYDRTLEEKETIEGTIAEKQAAFDANAKKIEALSAKTAKEPDLETPQAALSALREKKAALAQEKTASTVSLEGMKSLLTSADAGQAAKCPTCGSEISTAEGRAHLEGEIKALEDALAKNAAATAEVEAQIEKKTTELDIAKMAVRTYQKDVKDLDVLKSQNEGLSRDMAEARKRVATFAETIEKTRGDALGKPELKRLDDEIAELACALERENEMKTAYYAVARDEQTLAANKDRLIEIEKTGAEKREYLKNSAKVVGALENRRLKKEKLEAEAEKYQSFLQGYQEARAASVSQLQAAQGNLKVAKEQAESLITLQDTIECHLAAQQVVEYLRKTLPARITPRLANEASHILEIATNGRYTMLDLDESYEVYVYAEDDIRPLAMMSGGEADVISLSVRIAIAKLLLEATGITEQTFILDEIFGALDDERRESTCVALQNISQQLSKILCITHIDEIKDMADYTFIVEMDENGVSHVREVLDASENQQIPSETATVES